MLYKRYTKKNMISATLKFFAMYHGRFAHILAFYVLVVSKYESVVKVRDTDPDSNSESLNE